MSNEESKNNNIKKILAYFLIGILIIISAIFDNNHNSNDTDFATSNSIINTITYTLDNVPEYSGSPYIEINGGIPNFEDQYLDVDFFENYSKLDNLGRCGVAFAKLGKETMPTDEDTRKSIDHIIPTAWHDDKLEMLKYRNLYNRCHLIAYSLSNENDNEKNLITGTRYFNTSGMTGFENEVKRYIESNPDNHVLYRVTPIFEGNNLLASGVQIEAKSVEDNGKDICFNVYVYNVQPGVEIDYSTGDFIEKE